MDIGDQTLLLQASVGDVILSVREEERADLSGNGTGADVSDVTLMSDYLTGDIDTFPVCSLPGYTKDPPTAGRPVPCWGPNGGVGDLNANGRVDIGDQVLINQASVGDVILSVREEERADLNGNGTGADIGDVTLLSGYLVGDIDAFPVCSMTPSGMETRTMSLEEGKSYDIEVQLSDHELLKATIRVAATGIICETVTNGACGGSSLPRVETDVWTVTTHLKSTSGGSNYSEWLANKGGLNEVKLDDIFELKDAFIGLEAIGFTPILEQIMECKDAFIGL